MFNGLTDKWHPTQVLADVMTMREHSEKPIQQISYAYVGDTRNNMGHSLLLAGCLMGMDVRICGPAKLSPADDVIALGRDLEQKTGARLTITADPKEAVAGVDFVYTDVWVSLGEPKEVWKERIDLLLPYQVNAGADEPPRATRTSGSCTACRPSTTPRRRSAARSARPTA